MTDRDDALVAPTDVRGRGRGEPIVLVPGGLTGWASWLPHAERLVDAYRVVRTQLLGVDLGLRGEPLPLGYDLRMETRALLRAFDAVGLAQAHVVGWSYGGGIALDLALERPERVRTLTLVEPAAPWVLEGFDRVDPTFEASRRLMASLDTDEVGEDQLEAFLYDAGIVPVGDDARSHEGWPRWVEHRRSLRAAPAAYRHQDDVRRLAGLDLPLLLFKGVGSTTFDRAIVDLLVAACPDARAEELPGAHVLPIVSMDAFLATLTAFVDEHPIEG